MTPSWCRSWLLCRRSPEESWQRFSVCSRAAPQIIEGIEKVTQRVPQEGTHNRLGEQIRGNRWCHSNSCCRRSTVPSARIRDGGTCRHLHSASDQSCSRTWFLTRGTSSSYHRHTAPAPACKRVAPENVVEASQLLFLHYSAQ